MGNWEEGAHGRSIDSGQNDASPRMCTGSPVKKKHIVSLSLGELEGEKPCLGSEIFTRDSFLSDCSLSEIRSSIASRCSSQSWSSCWR